MKENEKPNIKTARGELDMKNKKTQNKDTWKICVVIGFFILLFCIAYLQLIEDDYMVSYGKLENQYYKDNLNILVIDLEYEYFEFTNWRSGSEYSDYHNYMLGDYVKIEYTIDSLGNLYLINIEKHWNEHH